MLRTSLGRAGTAVLKSIGTAVCLFMCVTLSAIPSKPEPPRLVNDFAGVFTTQQCAELEERLVAYSDSTSTQIAVVTVFDLEDQESSVYATEIGIRWQVGSERFDNGVVILVKPKTSNANGDVFIAVGYGLEGAIPDAYAKSIIDRVMIPKFIENDYYGAVSEACNTIIKLADGEEFTIEDNVSLSEMKTSIIISVFILAIVIFLIIYAAKGNGNSSNRRGGRGGFGHTYSSGGFGSYSGGGGFGGGFGGFGGGSFGGGGAGGKW